MPGKRQPTDVVVANGRKHLSRSEEAERRAGEVRVEPPKTAKAPKWLPEGFEFAKVTVNFDAEFLRIAATYKDNEKEAKIVVRRCNSEEVLDKFSLEKQEGQQDTKYIKGGVVHSVAQNNAAYTASWTNGLNMVSIMGDVTEEELERMIDSIYT